MIWKVKQTIEFEIEANTEEELTEIVKTHKITSDSDKVINKKQFPPENVCPYDANGNLMVFTVNTDTHQKTYYSPSCKYGFKDCILDPQYIKATYPKWYKELGCPKGCDNDCVNGDQYDDEDK